MPLDFYEEWQKAIEKLFKRKFLFPTTERFVLLIKIFFKEAKDLNTAWKYHRQVIDSLRSQTKAQVLKGKLDINTAPVDQLQLIGLPQNVLKSW